MKSRAERTIGMLAELGRRLEGYGADARSEATVAAACRANGWFTPDDIGRAVEAIRERMLQAALLRAWLSRYPACPVSRPRNVLIVMAGNLPLVGFFDLLCVVASGHRALVKPSSKDSVLILDMIERLCTLDAQVRIDLYDGSQRYDAVIATGSENANRLFRSRYGALPSLLRGNRSSVAVLRGDEDRERLQALADDIFAYSGLGCRNVSLLLLPRGYDAAALGQKLGTPRRPNPKFRNNYLQARALLTLRGEPFIDTGHALLVHSDEFPAEVSRIHYTFYDSDRELVRWLSQREQQLQCVVCEGALHPRAVPFGEAQRPALSDYADARDVMAFLGSLQ